MVTRDEVFQPWTITGPSEEDGAWVIRIQELPGFLVAAASKDEALDELLPALIAFLESYKATGEAIPPGRSDAGWSVLPPPNHAQPRSPDDRGVRLQFQPEIDWTRIVG